MTVLGVNRMMNLCRIRSDSGKVYICPTKHMKGEMFFLFKKQWYSVAEYASDDTDELVYEKGQIISRPYQRGDSD